MRKIDGIIKIVAHQHYLVLENYVVLHIELLNFTVCITIQKSNHI